MTVNHFQKAQHAFILAVLPDKAFSGAIRAALDGTGNTSRLGEAVRGAKEDLFEVVPQLQLSVRSLLQGLREL